MIKRLKRRFIIINMTLVGLLILLILISISVLTYNSEINQAYHSLEHATNFFNRDRFPEIEGDSASTMPPEIEPAPEIPKHELDMPTVYAVSVLVDFNGKIAEIFDIESSIDTALLVDATDDALSGGDYGTLHSHNLMYLKKHVNNGYLIAFISTDSINSTMRNTILISLAIFVLSMLLVFFISERLAKYSIKPVDEAWKKQKQFVADASHDLKTPLTVILANTDILKSNTESTISDEMKWIESTKNEAVYMKALVERLLDLAKSERLKDEISLSEENISLLTSSVVLQLEAIAYERSIEIVSSITEELYAMSCAEPYTRLISILIDNAIKYSKQDKIYVSLYTNNKKIIFSVKNFGSTLSSEDLSQIFERFYRADKSRSTEGHGLGLPIAKNLSNALGCILSVTSDEQNGTVFSVTMKKRQ
ncbi:MAG: HAMP domain-containing histidine kinase [Clostridia bacterium]|nr:HAMP domain-containing histidine kinase [Clostridia bacterium]